MTAPVYRLINLNNIVRVKITDRGMAIMRENHGRLAAPYIAKGIWFPEFSPPHKDEEGWHHMQLWQVMMEFGPYLFLAIDPQNMPIETTMAIQIEGGDIR